LGDGETKDESAPSTTEVEIPPPPSSQRGVNAIAPELAQPGRYSVRPGRRETREFTSPETRPGATEVRRQTTRMPSFAGLRRAAALLTSTKASAMRPRRLPAPATLREQLESREAYVLSLLDGELSLQSLLDVTAMNATDLGPILDRLVALGLASLTS